MNFIEKRLFLKKKFRLDKASLKHWCVITCLDNNYISITMYRLYILAVFSMLCTLHTIAIGHDTEPRCSKFHYDEQLLEKMIRMEHSSSLMMEEFRALKAQISSDLESVKAEKENMKTVLQEKFEQIRATMTAETDKNRQVLEELKGTLNDNFDFSYKKSVYN